VPCTGPPHQQRARGTFCCTTGLGLGLGEVAGEWGRRREHGREGGFWLASSTGECCSRGPDRATPVYCIRIKLPHQTSYSIVVSKHGSCVILKYSRVLCDVFVYAKAAGDSDRGWMEWAPGLRGLLRAGAFSLGCESAPAAPPASLSQGVPSTRVELREEEVFCRPIEILSYKQSMLRICASLDSAYMFSFDIN
jgi:hypothetical protein